MRRKQTSNEPKTWMNSEDVMEDDAVCIDREQEDIAVAQFQQTGNLKLLEQVYVNRIPTLKSWAHRHYYPGLTFSIDDLYEDLCVVFVKAAEKYDKSKGPFNTWLFTLLLNRLKNIKNSKHAKKRLPEEYEGAAIGMVLSLDYPYNANDGSEVTLKDVIPASNPTETDYVLTNTFMDETLNVLARNNTSFRKFLEKVGEGNSLVSLIREYKIRKGSIKVSLEQAKQFTSRNCKRMVSELLTSKNITEGKGFKLLGYTIEGTSRLEYEIELKKTAETDMIMRSLREIRKNKDVYKKRIESTVE